MLVERLAPIGYRCYRPRASAGAAPMALGTGGEDERDWVIAASRGDEQLARQLLAPARPLAFAVGVFRMTCACACCRLFPMRSGTGSSVLTCHEQIRGGVVLTTIVSFM